MALQAPFPWFGGKSRVASLIWEWFGQISNYVEPFAGSLAVLLGRPYYAGATETVNDLDCYLANFWRALRDDPVAVAEWADYPVNEADLLARHAWLLSLTDFRSRMRTDPDFYDAKIAGWWLWGIGTWIGSGWCTPPAEQLTLPLPALEDTRIKLPHLSSAGMGVHRKKLPHLGDGGRGVHRKGLHQQYLPDLGGGRGVHRKTLRSGRSAAIVSYMETLGERLRGVRVACGDWSRVLTDSCTIYHGTTGVFLDPPYDADEHTVRYAAGTEGIAAGVHEWAEANGGNPLLRIALCGYEGEHNGLLESGWRVVEWKARGGYGSQGNGRARENAGRERVWFSPACSAPLDLFGSHL